MKRFFSLAILPLIILLFYNQVANWHFHRLPTGIVIEHAHPYSKSSSGDSPYANHSHSELELFILGLLSTTIALVVLIVLADFFSTSNHQKASPLPVAVFANTQYHSKYNPHRGPPCI